MSHFPFRWRRRAPQETSRPGLWSAAGPGWVCLAILPIVLAGQEPVAISNELPASAATKLATSLAAARVHATHVWRDTPAINQDGSLNAYIEIARGDRRKWELDMAANARAIDRIIPEQVGGYPVNYGFVPQTVSYDGDPFDVLVLGPPIDGGRIVRAAIVGLMLMEDDNVTDAKVVASTMDASGRPNHALTENDQRLISDYFRRYKQHEPGKRTEVPGWGSITEGLGHVRMTHAFFQECRQLAGAPCRVTR